MSAVDRPALLSVTNWQIDHIHHTTYLTMERLPHSIARAYDPHDPPGKQNR
jgi:hypothetical protein